MIASGLRSSCHSKSHSVKIEVAFKTSTKKICVLRFKLNEWVLEILYSESPHMLGYLSRGTDYIRIPSSWAVNPIKDWTEDDFKMWMVFS